MSDMSWIQRRLTMYPAPGVKLWTSPTEFPWSWPSSSKCVNSSTSPTNQCAEEAASGSKAGPTQLPAMFG